VPGAAPVPGANRQSTPPPTVAPVQSTGATPSPGANTVTPVKSTSSSGSSPSTTPTAGTPQYTPSPPLGGRVAPTFLTRRVTFPRVQSQYDFRYSEAESFLTYLETNCREAADALWSDNKFHLKISFEDFRKQDRTLSHKICNKFDEYVYCSTYI
jgi:hypothetical protein